MTDKFTLEPLVVGRFPAFPLKRFLYQIDSSEIIEAPCISWLARSTSTDALVLVDTGPASPTEETSKFHVEIDVKRENRIDLVLHNHGVDPEQITDVVFTHLHFDHCSYAEFLPNASPSFGEILLVLLGYGQFRPTQFTEVLVDELRVF